MRLAASFFSFFHWRSWSYIFLFITHLSVIFGARLYTPFLDFCKVIRQTLFKSQLLYCLTSSVYTITDFIVMSLQIATQMLVELYLREVCKLQNFCTFVHNVRQNDWFWRIYKRRQSIAKGKITCLEENLVLGTSHLLRNRDMHISQSVTSLSPKCQDGTLNVTLDEMAVLDFVTKNPSSTQMEIASHIGKSLRTVKRIMSAMSKKGLL